MRRDQTLSGLLAGLLFLLVAVAIGCATRNGREAARDAEAAIEAKRQTYEVYGLRRLDSFWDAVMLDLFSVEVVPVAGCMVTDEIVESTKAHNRVVDAYLARAFGADWSEQAARECARREQAAQEASLALIDAGRPTYLALQDSEGFMTDTLWQETLFDLFGVPSRRIEADRDDSTSWSEAFATQAAHNKPLYDHLDELHGEDWLERLQAEVERRRGLRNGAAHADGAA